MKWRLNPERRKYRSKSSENKARASGKTHSQPQNFQLPKTSLLKSQFLAKLRFPKIELQMSNYYRPQPREL